MSNEARAVTAIRPPAPAVFIGADQKNSNPREKPSLGPDLRLVIEEGPKRGSFVYKTVDRATGETVKQYPREALVKLSEAPDYVAGSLMNTRV